MAIARSMMTKASESLCSRLITCAERSRYCGSSLSLGSCNLEKASIAHLLSDRAIQSRKGSSSEPSATVEGASCVDSRAFECCARERCVAASGITKRRKHVEAKRSDDKVGVERERFDLERVRRLTFRGQPPVNECV